MTNLPGYVSIITIAGIAGILAATVAALYRGTRESGGSPRLAAGVAVVAGTLLGGWAGASAAISLRGGYHSASGQQPPWLPIAALGAIVVLLGLSRLRVVRTAFSGPGALQLLSWPHTLRVVGIVFLLAMAYGQLPALFALPAGIGDITVGVSEPFVARLLRRDRGSGRAGRRLTTALNIFGLVDLITALALGGLLGFGVIAVTPSGAAVSQLPLVLIPTVGVPVLFVLHILRAGRLLRTGRRQQLLITAAAGRAA